MPETLSSPACPPTGGTDAVTPSSRQWLLAGSVLAGLHLAMLAAVSLSTSPARSVDTRSLMMVHPGIEATPAAAPAPQPAVPATRDSHASPEQAPPVPPGDAAGIEALPVRTETVPGDTTSTSAPVAAPARDEAPATNPQDTVTPGANASPAAASSYLGQLKGWLNHHKRYPIAARKARQQGVVVVSFTIDRRGQLLGARIEQSSGHPALDEAALALLRRAAPMPRIPDAMDTPTLTVNLPIDYSLITR